MIEDLAPLFRSTVGFDRAARLMEAARHRDGGTNYPPYDIEAIGETAYAVTLAVAGFEPDDLLVEVRDGMLIVAGRKASGKGEDGGAPAAITLHRGIASRDFLRKFHLAEHVKVTGARLENGLLRIDLAREEPKAKAPLKIAIAAGAPKNAHTAAA
ncbi:Hsp20 family protein [Caenispirillum bisanense]|uniref:Molecular chaperone IbpA n=1 Tax=Caenispirillum bisanense TaxID=414052 RepID=A0A286G831_9PROT|nr:Hsp20 family protein [Caenispirillum bisanense]SOD91144.1 molecular chaperone IbpA [Caenispirillum bisanense]